jgi:glutamate racemase
LQHAGHHITQRIAQPLSQFVEAGDLSSETLKTELRRILRPLAGVDALLLACTHYPALAAPLQEQLPGVRLLDPAAEMSRWIRRTWLTRSELTLSGSSPRILNAQKPPANSITFLTTGDPAGFQRAGSAAFRVNVIAPQHVQLNH